MSEYLITTENRLTLAQAANAVEVSSPSTVFRWIKKGQHGVKLKSARLGGRLFTSEAAIDEYMNLVSQAKASEAEAVCL